MSAVRRRFDKTLYERSALDEATKTYADFATIEVEAGEDAWTVTFDGVDKDVEPEVLASEFANFVLAETVQRKR